MNADATGNKLYFDDLHVGQRFTSRQHSLDTEAVRAFAEQFDPQPFHLDEAAAKHSLFKGMVASGWHTAAITMRLIVESVPIAGGVIGLGGEISWPGPARPGTMLHLETTVVELRPSKSRPDRGIVTLRCETVNEHGETVQKLVTTIVVPRKAWPTWRQPLPQSKQTCCLGLTTPSISMHSDSYSVPRVDGCQLRNG